MKTVVLPDTSTTVTLDNVTDKRIYAFKIDDSVYKAQKIEEGFAFVSLNDSRCWANGSRETLQELIKDAIAADWIIYEFNTLREFTVWLYDNT